MQKKGGDVHANPYRRFVGILRMEIMMKTALLLCRVCTVMIAACLLALLLPLLPVLFGYFPTAVLVQTGSSYDVGSLTYYRYAKVDEIQVGSCIVENENPNAAYLVTERMEMQQYFVVKDNSTTRKIEFELVDGRVTDFRIPFYGYVIDWFCKPLVLLLLTGLLILCVSMQKMLEKHQYKPRYGK